MIAVRQNPSLKKAPWRIAHDIEVAPNFFSNVAIDLDSSKYWIFEISQRRNDLEEMLQFYEKIQYAVGFNSTGYDSIILDWLYRGRRKFSRLSPKSLNDRIYKKSDEIIDHQAPEGFL